MFIDEVIMEIEAGRGGDGCMAFLREKFVPMGGPNGGNGGKGADIIFKADEGLKTLIDLRYMKNVKGAPGLNGEGKNKNGSYAENKIIKVPVGTTVKDFDTNLVIADLTKDGQRFVIAKGGMGGRGNDSYKSSTNQAPRRADPGEPGEELAVWLKLKLIADIGLVGMPNAGKSTLLTALTKARPKIANYPFTTLHPHLGVAMVDGKEILMADIPGLIEGASEGIGLGTKFLKHVERCSVLIHLIDGTEPEPFKTYQSIRNELKSYAEKLALKPEIIAINKCDCIDNETLAEIGKEFTQKAKIQPIFISAIANKNLTELLRKAATFVPEKQIEAIEEIKDENDIE